ncbi:MAG: hypothetical protein JKY54_01150 [Flavobacteriales bacterium]|nr:hypothetical protein [Flavobacteriales bacterium]
MKKLAYLSLISLLLLATSPTHAGNNESKSESLSIHVKGHVLNTVGKVRKFSLNVYEKGQLIYKMKSYNGKFEYILPFNSEVMLEFIAEDHYVKRIAVRSSPKSDLKKVPTLILSINMLSSARFPELSVLEDLLDFPSAFLAYNDKGKLLNLNKHASKVIYAELDKALKDIMAGKQIEITEVHLADKLLAESK